MTSLSTGTLSDNKPYLYLGITAVEAAAQRGLAAEKDVEVRRQVCKTEKVEAALTQVRVGHNHWKLDTDPSYMSKKCYTLLERVWLLGQAWTPDLWSIYFTYLLIDFILNKPNNI